jgi:hypothetical protein
MRPTHFPLFFCLVLWMNEMKAPSATDSNLLHRATIHDPRALPRQVSIGAEVRECHTSNLVRNPHFPTDSQVLSANKQHHNAPSSCPHEEDGSSCHSRGQKMLHRTSSQRMNGNVLALRGGGKGDDDDSDDAELQAIRQKMLAARRMPHKMQQVAFFFVSVCVCVCVCMSFCICSLFLLHVCICITRFQCVLFLM